MNKHDYFASAFSRISTGKIISVRWQLYMELESFSDCLLAAMLDGELRLVFLSLLAFCFRAHTRNCGIRRQDWHAGTVEV